MPTPDTLFRKEALAHHSATAGTAMRVQLVRPADHAALAMMAILMALGGFWLVFGQVNVRVDGQGILLRPRVLRGAGTEGQALSSAVLTSMDAPALLQQQEQLRTRLDAARTRDTESDAFWAQEIAVERASIAKQQAELDARLVVLDGLAQTQKQTAARVAAERRRQLQKQEADAATLAADWDAEVLALEQAGARGATTRSQLANARANALSARQALDAVRQAIAALPLDDVAAAQRYDGLLAQISEVRAAREALAERMLTLTRTDQERRANTLDARVVLENQLDAVTLALKRQHPSADSTEIPEPSGTDPLLVVVFMDAADAKRVVPGMKLNVSPDSVERARYGSAMGVVSEISDYPVTPQQADALLANTPLADTLARSGRSVLLIARLEVDAATPSGYRWTSSTGPPGELTAGTTVTASVTVEHRRPITWFLPILRNLIGVEG